MKNYVSLKNVPVYIKKNQRGFALHIILAARPSNDDEEYNLKVLSNHFAGVFDEAVVGGWKDFYDPFGGISDGQVTGIVAPVYFNTMRYDKEGNELNVTYDRNGNPRNITPMDYAHFISASMSATQAAKGALDELYKADVSIMFRPTTIDNVRHLLVRVVDYDLKNN